jgi:RNA polymerase sigma-70 factor (ECF subfamily)
MPWQDDLSMVNGEQDEDGLQLASRLMQGDPAAVVELVERYADALYRFVYNQVGSVQDAEDIVQDTFIAALRAIRRFRGESRLRTWLFSIAIHKMVDQQREAGRRLATVPHEMLPVLQEPNPQPEQVLEELELHQMVRQALLKLPLHYRTALILKYVEDMSVNEISKIMHRSQKSVESVLVRARRLFSDLIGEENAGRM